MRRTLGIMFTLTTYGTWLRGDARGWVDDGRVLSANPTLQTADRRRMKHPPFLFDRGRLLEVGSMIGSSLRQRLSLKILAMTVRTWHVHAVIAATPHPIAKIVKCAKDAARWGLRPNRPIWTAGYDKRFCFDERSLQSRIDYVERHNAKMGWPAKPWEFVERWPLSES